MNDSPSWLSDHFWCNTCSRVIPKLPWWKDMAIESLWILGTEFRAFKCQHCGNVNVDKKYPKEMQ